MLITAPVPGPRLAQPLHPEPYALELRMIEDVATVEYERGLVHGVENALEIKRLKLFPFCDDDDGVRILARLVGVSRY